MATKTPGQAASARAYMARRRAATKVARAAAKAAGLVYEEPTLTGVWDRDGGQCYLCGTECLEPGRTTSRQASNRPTMDHIVPLSRGGFHNYDNLRLCCFACNRAKSDDLLGEAVLVQEADQTVCVA